MLRLMCKTAVTASLALFVAGCESHSGNGALLGGAAGAGLGAIIGHNSHGRTTDGALIGGAAGALGGGLIGNEMDKNERRERESAERYYDRDGYYERDHYYDNRYRDYDRPSYRRSGGYYEYRYRNDPYGRCEVYESRTYRD